MFNIKRVLKILYLISNIFILNIFLNLLCKINIFMKIKAGEAQLVEQSIEAALVVSSSLISSN
jgi:hypothetical protein